MSKEGAGDTSPEKKTVLALTIQNAKFQIINATQKTHLRIKFQPHFDCSFLALSANGLNYPTSTNRLILPLRPHLSRKYLFYGSQKSYFWAINLNFIAQAYLQPIPIKGSDYLKYSGFGFPYRAIIQTLYELAPASDIFITRRCGFLFRHIQYNFTNRIPLP